MKRAISLSLSLLLILALAACAPTAAPAPGGSSEVDAYTTATETKYIADKVLMEKAELETRMADMLKGPGDYREMYTLGTSHNNVPLTSAIEFVYDSENVRFYGTSDLGTEKLEQMKLNDQVSLGWVRMLTPDELSSGETYFSISEGVQVSGKAVIVDGNDSRYEDIMKIYIPTMGKEYTKEYSDKLKNVCAVVEIIPERIVVRNVGFRDTGFNYLQIWRAK